LSEIYNDTKYEFISEILKTHGKSIKKMFFQGYATVCDMISMLQFTPNLEWLHLNTSINIEHKKMTQESKEDFPALKSLKTLSLTVNAIDDIKMFSKLPVNVLRELKMTCLGLDAWKSLEMILSRQKNIKKLEMIDTYGGKPATKLSETIFNNLQLTHFIFTTHKSMEDEQMEALIEVISKQKELKHLSLCKFPMTDELLKTVVERLKNLESFEFCVRLQKLSPEIFSRISQLNRLKSLKIESFKNGNKIFRALSEMDISRYNQLTIKHDECFNEIISTISKRFQNVENLKSLTCSTQTFFEMTKFISKFRRLESLKFTGGLHFGMNKNDAFLKHNYLNENLRELEIEFEFEYPNQFLKMLVKNFPNVKKFTIQPKFKTYTNVINASLLRHFRTILKGFRKLTHLEWRSGGDGLEDEDLSLILEHGQSLQFVKLCNIAIEDAASVRSMFLDRFEIVKISHCSLMMAVNHDLLKNYMTNESWKV
jgi:hypothetical protein